MTLSTMEAEYIGATHTVGNIKLSHWYGASIEPGAE